MGSASLATQLIEHDLVDEYRLMIEPILLGGGKQVFPGDGQARALELVSATTTGTGVLICTYRPAGAFRPGHPAELGENDLVACGTIDMLWCRSPTALWGPVNTDTKGGT